MTSPEAVLVSYRLGGADGVAVEAAKWERALRELGFRTRRVAGEFEDALRPDDAWLAFLAIDPHPAASPDPGALGAAIGGADLVVVENLCSLPLNETAALLAREVLDRHRGRVCFHHHDLAWERAHLAHVEGLPPTRPGSLHVTISEHARQSLLQRGLDAVCIPNSFHFDRHPGDRAATRAAMGFAPEDLVLLQPTRALARKNLPAGLRYGEALATRFAGRTVRYWITGPAEDGFDAELAALIRAADIPVSVGRARRAEDAYAAADLVMFPSTWEGFGNPVIEAVAARRMVVVGSYPVLAEITDGLRLLSIDRVDDGVAWLEAPDPRVLEANFARARARFSVAQLPARIRAAFFRVGWTDW